MIGAEGVLLDDRAFVEVLRHIMTRGPDIFDAAFVGLVIRPRANEAGEKAVVDVDEPQGIFVAHPTGENLHEAGQDDCLGLRLLNEAVNFREGRFFIGSVGGDMVEGDLVPFDKGPAVLVIGDDRPQIETHFAAAPAIEKIVQTVSLCTDQDDDEFGNLSIAEGPLHIE